MITREQAKYMFRIDTDDYGKPKAIMTKLNNIYDDFEQKIKELQATIEAQEIIIKDKSAIMEAMAQPKTCDSCKHNIYHTRDNFHNVTIYKCNIRNQLHFNGSCDGLVCDKYEPKAQP